MCTNANKGYEQFIPKIDISGSLKTKSKLLTREMMKNRRNSKATSGVCGTSMESISKKRY